MSVIRHQAALLLHLGIPPLGFHEPGLGNPDIFQPQNPGILGHQTPVFRGEKCAIDEW